MDRYQILKGYQNNHLTIGFGSYGQVKLGKDLQSGKIVAIKMIYKIAQNEMLLHSKLSHPNIISLIDIHIDQTKQITYLILEYAEEGTLYDKIKMGQLTKTEIKKYFKDICQGLAYLHEKGIMHRDIKPENILISKNNEAKVCDFGVATFASERKTLCGTYEYMSPEMILNKPYDYKIDVWALGILLFEMIAGNAPFRGDKPQMVLEQMKTKIYFSDNFDNQDISFIKQLLRVNPAKRPEVKDILKHIYFSTQEKLQKTSSTTYQDSSVGNSHQLWYQTLNRKQMYQLQKRIEIANKKQTYPPFYIAQQNRPKKIGRTLSFYDQQMKTQQTIRYRVPSFITSSQKFIKPIQIDSLPTTLKYQNQPISPISPLRFKRSNNKVIEQSVLNAKKQE